MTTVQEQPGIGIRVRVRRHRDLEPWRGKAGTVKWVHTIEGVGLVCEVAFDDKKLRPVVFTAAELEVE